jgi:hypothetical protein
VREKRLKGFAITAELVADIIAKHHDLPDDAEYRMTNYDIDRDAFVLYLSHPSFELVPECCAIPIEGRAIR